MRKMLPSFQEKINGRVSVLHILVHTGGETFGLCKGGWYGHNLRVVTDELCQEGMKTDIATAKSELVQGPAVWFTRHMHNPARPLALAIKCFFLVCV